jgi:hypothetical protein
MWNGKRGTPYWAYRAQVLAVGRSNLPIPNHKVSHLTFKASAIMFYVELFLPGPSKASSHGSTVFATSRPSQTGLQRPNARRGPLLFNCLGTDSNPEWNQDAGLSGRGQCSAEHRPQQAARRGQHCESWQGATSARRKRLRPANISPLQLVN